jgi:hypothetical protein
MTRFWQCSLILAPALIMSACTATLPPTGPKSPLEPLPAPGLARLIGLEPLAVTRLLGPASLDRSEGPARQLQFIRPVCVLDVFLYPRVAGGTLQVRTAAARKPDGGRIDAGACLALLLSKASR